MIVLRLLLFFFLGLMLRRFYLSLKSGTRRAAPRTRPTAEGAPTQRPLDDLSRQDISDADYEEIP